MRGSKLVKMGAILGLVGTMATMDLTPAWAQDDYNFGNTDEGPPQDGPPTEAMANALRLYQQDKYKEACVQFQRVVEGETHDFPANVQKAQFNLGKCLFHLHFYQSSLAVFVEIVEKPNHSYFGATLQWLAQLAAQLPEPANIVKHVGQYQMEQLNQFNNNESKQLYYQLLYMLGRAKYQDGELDQAIDLFKLVTTDSRFYIQAKFFEGISHVRSLHQSPAIEAFQKVIEGIGRGLPGIEDRDRMVDLAWLELARVFYSGGHYDSAIEAWNHVDVDSEYWLDALFEESWAYFLMQDYPHALGNIHTLNSPFFTNSFYPESLVLKAVVQFSNCQNDDAENTIYQFGQRYGDVRDKLQEQLAPIEGDNAAFFQFLKDVRDGRSSMPARIRPIVETALSDRTLLRNIEYVNVLEAEERALEAMDPEFKNSTLGDRIRGDIAIAKSLAIDNAGDLAKGRYKRLMDDVLDLQNQTTAVLIEILNARRGTLSADALNQQVEARRFATLNVRADEEHYLWPFNGEFWRDELGFYRQQLINSCGR